MKKLFIDDERHPPDDGEWWYVAHDFSSATFFVIDEGVPDFISFDHDLGEGRNGSDFVNWLIDHMLDEGLKFPAGFDFYVHSQNPVGAQNIREKMNAAIRTIGRYE